MTEPQRIKAPATETHGQKWRRMLDTYDALLDDGRFTATDALKIAVASVFGKIGQA